MSLTHWRDLCLLLVTESVHHLLARFHELGRLLLDVFDKCRIIACIFLGRLHGSWVGLGVQEEGLYELGIVIDGGIVQTRAAMIVDQLGDSIGRSEVLHSIEVAVVACEHEGRPAILTLQLVHLGNSVLARH